MADDPGSNDSGSASWAGLVPGMADGVPWADVGGRLQAMWLEFLADRARETEKRHSHYTDPATWLTMLDGWRQASLPDPRRQMQLWEKGLSLWQSVLGQYGIGPDADAADGTKPDLPRRDRRFADSAWRESPLPALVHQSYLLMAEELAAMADELEPGDTAKKAQLHFFTEVVLDALSPSNFLLTNPQALARAAETKGESVVKGFAHLLTDLKRGQLTHTDPSAFTLGENIAVTPGKVVHETPLYQLIQYTPVTDKVLATPLVIFPPWINRYYILDLNPAKSFVRWAVEQGISVLMVSWKSADASMADVVWDDYIAAEIDAIDTIRARLDVPSVHAIGYCVAGTTLAAALAIMARRGDADRVKSATFFTAQVDFNQAGDLKHFIDDAQIAAIRKLAPDGYLDGRVMAATFNLLRGRDLLWSYVVKNYLLGEDYPAFDLLHWNGDVTNLPAKWHEAYLRDLYRDNRLVVADSLSALGTPIDIGRIETPCYIQAGREDHIAPPESVWKMTRYLKGDWTFVLAGSGHIAGVVNPPAAGKYQHWTNDGPAGSLDEFIAGASEHKGSWWPHWAQWLCLQESAEVPADGKRDPGGAVDPVVEDAPGRYVRMR
jgi:polyhydroxyalkanoate synthase subunit PhaC